MNNERHEHDRHMPYRCACGYEARDRSDLDEHVEAMQRVAR